MADSIPAARLPQEQSVAVAHAVAPGESGLRTLIDAASDAIISVDSQHRIVLFNRAAREAFGWTEAEALGRPLSMLLPPEARGDHEAKIQAFAAEPQAWRRMTGERPRTTGQRKNGTRFPAEVTISKAFVEGEWRFTAIVRDVSERHTFEDRLERLSLYDSLTGLPNRVLLSERLATALATIQEGAAVAVLFVDIDHFKRINDALGHIAGDELLAEFATRLPGLPRSLPAPWSGTRTSPSTGPRTSAGIGPSCSTRRAAAGRPSGSTSNAGWSMPSRAARWRFTTNLWWRWPTASSPASKRCCGGGTTTV
jgi:PAS domain S-box-containing protein